MSSNFKTWVCSELIRLAKLYDDYFVKNVYLIVSPYFTKQKYYKISASEKNFLHLTGVKTKFNSYQFFKKCLDGSLTTNDFDYYPFVQDAHNKNDIKQKLHCLNEAIGLFSSRQLFFQEGYSKNHINCAFITSEGTFTMGFIKNYDVLLPNTILKKNQTGLDSISSGFVILKMIKGSEKFDTIVRGSRKQIKSYCHTFSDMLSAKLFDLLS